MQPLKASRPTAAFAAREPRPIDLAWRQIDQDATAKMADPQAASRRLIGARYSPAIPQTALSAALLAALARKAGA